MISGPSSSPRLWLRQLGSRAPWRISSNQKLSTSTRHAASIEAIPSTQPPSARPVETRKSQLIRTYTSLMRSSPVILLFQHSNLTADEWAAVRRELKRAVTAVNSAGQPDLANLVQLQVIRTNMFNVALKIIEFFTPEAAAAGSASRLGEALTHDLSEAAYKAMREAKPPPTSSYAQIEPLMVGPLAALALPVISPAYLAAALTVLAPVPGKFPAPTRRKCPGYHDPVCQNGLAKLVLVGGRIEGKVFDQAGVGWVAGIEGGLDGLRSHLVSILQGTGLGLTTTLESGARSVWLALEGRKKQLDEGGAPAKARRRKAAAWNQGRTFTDRRDDTLPPLRHRPLHQKTLPNKKRKGRATAMDFAPYQSSPPEHSRVASPESVTSPRPSLDALAASRKSPPPLQHPQPRRAWGGDLDGHTADGGGGGGGGVWASNDLSEFDTSLGLRLDYEACLAYLALPPLGAIVLLILERNSDYVRFHAWQSALLFTAILVLHIVISWSSFLSWILFFGDVALVALLTLKAYRDAETLDRFEVPLFGTIASRILDDE
ncbi:hypothetical protein L249_5955 [Ophiocordyceps polyrhachis-furcata BCC 54312]|uniref:Uncharacterized protein n=1 Tax=Ophiocordyceps polyrhachis-furcata BCC 54312 TaxID=1330021 RepID=A0A367LIV6_9HYPO|nr:hypothetical protein L249_5955 [Ophiocordyceps polyrhachis-furcata BCC 54312]